MNIGGKEERGKPRNRLLTIENKLMITRGEVGGRMGKQVMGIKECTCCDEHQVLYVHVEYVPILHLKLILHRILTNWNKNTNLKNKKIKVIILSSFYYYILFSSQLTCSVLLVSGLEFSDSSHTCNTQCSSEVPSLIPMTHLTHPTAYLSSSNPQFSDLPLWGFFYPCSSVSFLKFHI